MAKNTAVDLFLMFWFPLWMDTLVLGFMYHHVDSFKKKCDAFWFGTAMVSVFHGKTNTVFNKILPSVAKNTVAAIGGNVAFAKNIVPAIG